MAQPGTARILAKTGSVRLECYHKGSGQPVPARVSRFKLLQVSMLAHASPGRGVITYQNDLRNSGSSNGTGYFSLKTANFTDDSVRRIIK